MTVVVCLVALTLPVGRQLDDSTDADRPRVGRAWGLPRRRPPGLTWQALALSLVGSAATLALLAGHLAGW